MKKLHIDIVAQFSGTSEGAKKGWEKRKAGRMSWSDQRSKGASNFKVGDIFEVGNEKHKYQLASHPISKIEYQEGDPLFGSSQDEKQVKKMTNDFLNGADFPPPVGKIDDEGVFVIEDGHHRASAIQQSGAKNILVWTRIGKDKS